jgi:hypothetical protein
MNYKKLDYRNLAEVEKEFDTFLSIVDLDTISDEALEYLTGLMRLAKSLGSKREW